MSEAHSVEILLVEDNPHDSHFAQRAIRERTAIRQVVHVCDGQAALDFPFCVGDFAARQSGAPHLVLLDLKLPKVDGIEVLRRIRANEGTAQQPVVVLTSSREVSDLAATYALGVNSHVVKPVPAESFAEAISVVATYWVQFNQPPGRGAHGK